VPTLGFIFIRSGNAGPVTKGIQYGWIFTSFIFFYSDIYPLFAFLLFITAILLAPILCLSEGRFRRIQPHFSAQNFLLSLQFSDSLARVSQTADGL